MHNDGDDLFVRLFAMGLPKGVHAYWIKEMDILCIERKDESCRGHEINEFFDLQFAPYEDVIVGFKLMGFSTICKLVVETLNLESHERISLDALLLSYKAVTWGAFYACEDQNQDRLEFEQQQLQNLRDLFGGASIFQPKHALTVRM